MPFESLTAVLNLDSTGFSSGIDDAEDSMGSFEDRVSGAAQTAQRGGAALTAGVTAPLAAMGAMSVRVAGNFDQSMQKSIAVMGDVDAAMKENLEATAREVANTTTHSASQAADSYYFLASAGLDAAEAMEAMPQVAAFAEAGQLQMAEATNVATNVMSAYGREADEMASVTDTLTATVSNHNQTMQGMASAMSTVAPIASSLGISLEETSAAIGQMGDVGIQGERAGTALRNVMSQLSDESSTVTSELEKMGVATRNSSGEVVSITQLLSNMEAAGVEAGDAAKVFGTEAGPAMAALMQQGSDALAQNTQRIKESEGATKSMAATQRDTLNAEMQIAKSNIQDVGIAIGGDLIPMVSTLTAWIKAGSERFQGLNGEQRRAIIILGGVAAAIGPVLLVAGTLAQAIVALSGAYGVLTGAASTLAGVNMATLVPSLLATNVVLGPITAPVWLIIAAFGALAAMGAAVAYAWKNNVGGIRDATTDALGTVKGWLDSAPGWVLALMGPIGQLYLIWRENLFGIQDIVGSVFDWIGSKIDWLTDKIDAIPGIGGDVEAEADVDSDVPEPPEEPEGEPVTAPEAMPSPNQTDAASAAASSSTPSPEDVASESSPDTPTPEDLASEGPPTPTAASQSGTSGGGAMKKLLQEIRALKSALSGERKLSGDVEFDPSSGMITFVDGRIELAETQNFEDFNA